MSKISLFFYDLETSGLHPDSDRIMQFAGQRTDRDLNPLGEPINRLIKLNEDVLPDPSAVLIHGITPQQTLSEGLSEAEFLQEFYGEAVLPGTVFVGFNNIRFDDEFMRFLNYRNLYDPFAWSYLNNVSRWDMLDMARMTRALRPAGINWPTNDKNGSNINRLEHLTAANNLPHANAHDALADVLATIDFAKLVKARQPKLYNYLFRLRLKDHAAKLVNAPSPFIYTSSHYPSAQLHTTVVIKVTDHPSPNCVLVYDLRHDPTQWINKNGQELADAWRYTTMRSVDTPRLPIKTLRLNRCPAVAPLSVLNETSDLEQLQLDMTEVRENAKILAKGVNKFAHSLIDAVNILNVEQEERQSSRHVPPDAQLYHGFYSDYDRTLLHQLHLSESPQAIRLFRGKVRDPRLKQLASLYLARNYRGGLTAKEYQGWAEYLKRRLFKGGETSTLAVYFKQVTELKEQHLDPRSQVLLEDLKLYGESLIPSDIA
jgi:exodeoxyribonuclease-1